MSASLGRRVFHDKRPYILTLAVLALVNAGFFGGIVYPLQRRVATADQRAAAAAAELKAAESEHKLAQDTLVGKERAERELRRFYVEILPGDQSAARRLTYLRIAELARDANLDFEQRTFAIEDDRESSLRRLQIEMLLSGRYPDVRRFIYELERAKEFVIVAGVELVQREQEDTALDLTVRLATYFRAGSDGG